MLKLWKDIDTPPSAHYHITLRLTELSIQVYYINYIFYIFQHLQYSGKLISLNLYLNLVDCFIGMVSENMDSSENNMREEKLHSDPTLQKIHVTENDELLVSMMNDRIDAKGNFW